MKIRAVAIVACLFLVALATPNAKARQGDFEDAAAKIAGELRDAKLKKVAVFDFTGPSRNLTALGTRLADEFSDQLAHADGHPDVEDRATLARKMKESDYAPEDSLDSGSLLAMAHYLHMDAAVLGNITQQNEQFQITLRIMPSGGGNPKAIATESLVIPASDVLSKLAETILARETDRPDLNDPTYPVSGKNGYSVPRCTYCPPAEFSEAARNAKFQGTVTVVCVVTPEGRATDIHALNKLPGGLTQKAIEAVQRWQFEPATDSSGNPAAVRQVIEVTFHLY